jgi:hypothetical protein
MFPVGPLLCGVLAVLFSLLGIYPNVVRAEEVDPAILDASPGYNATNVKTNGATLTASLVLAGTPCNVFGDDIKVLTLTVVYESGTPALQRAKADTFLTNPLLPSCLPKLKPRNSHPPQDNRRVQRSLRSPQVRLPAACGGPKDVPGCGADTIWVQYYAVHV